MASGKVFFIILVASFMYGGLGSRKTANSTVTTVKTIHGDIYTCIDIYKQPSLEHPALKDPGVKKRTLKYLEEMVAKAHSIANSEPTNNGLWEDEGCPIGTVPFRQMPNEHLKLAPSPFNSFTNHSLDRSYPVEFAGIVVDGKPYYGASAIINIYNPQVPDGSTQFSAVSIILESVDNPFNQIRVGWIVHPTLYGDQKTRLYTSWTADNYHSTGCFNVQCSGFIVTNNQIPLDFVFPYTSSWEADQFDAVFSVALNDGRWELVAGVPPASIGYWPEYLFTNLKQNAQRIRFGGQIFAPLSDPTTPPMGSGQFVDYQFDKTCYMRDVYVKDASGINILPDPYIAESRCYFTGANEATNDPAWNCRFVFGGAGGEDGVTCMP